MTASVHDPVLVKDGSNIFRMRDELDWSQYRALRVRYTEPGWAESRCHSYTRPVSGPQGMM